MYVPLIRSLNSKKDPTSVTHWGTWDFVPIRSQRTFGDYGTDVHDLLQFLKFFRMKEQSLTVSAIFSLSRYRRQNVQILKSDYMLVTIMKGKLVCDELRQYNKRGLTL